MAVFEAFSKVDTTNLSEFSILNSPTQAFITDEATPTTLKVHVGDIAFHYTSASSDFTYGNPGPPHGTIEVLKVLADGASLYEFSDLNFQFDDLLSHFDGKTDISGAMAALFAGNDRITGSSFNDRLAGFDGDDLLKGGKGNDVFLFSGDLGPDNVDRVQDFKGKDKLGLDYETFGLLPGSKLSKSAFVVGSKAKDGNDRVIYDDKKGQLHFDADGKGGEKQVLFAILKDKPDIGAGDFVIS